MRYTRLPHVLMALVVGACLSCASPGQVPATAPWDSPTNAWVRASGGMLWGPYQTNRTPVAGSVQFDTTPLWHNGTGWVSFGAAGGYWSTNAVDGGIMYGGNVYAPTMTTGDNTYSDLWNGSTNVPTQNAIYDKIETLASVQFAPENDGPYLDDMNRFAYGSGSALAGPWSMTATATVEVVFDKIFFADIQGSSPNATNRQVNLYVYGDDFAFGTNGASGTILETMTVDPDDLQENVIWDFEPNLTISSGQVFTVLAITKDAAATNWTGSVAPISFARDVTTFPVGSSVLNMGPFVRWENGISAPQANYWGYPILMENLTNGQQTVERILPSDTLNLSVSSAGDLSIAARDNFMKATTDATALYYDAIAEASGTTNYYNTGLTSDGYAWQFMSGSDWIMEGFQMYCPATERGKQWMFFLKDPTLEKTYATVYVDDTDGSGGGIAWLTAVFPSPVSLVESNYYTIGWEFPSARQYDMYGYETLLGWNSDSYFQWVYELILPGLIPHADTYKRHPPIRVLLGETFGDPVSILEQGSRMEFVQSGNILTLQPIGGVVELSMPDAATQTITDAAGYVAITNWVENVNDFGWTTTQTNITVGTAGRYLVTFDGAFQTATASQLSAHVYTNGVIAADAAGNDIGWHRTQGAVTSDGVAACSRLINLLANDVVDFRIDAVGFDEDITWDTGTLRLERK